MKPRTTAAAPPLRLDALWNHIAGFFPAYEPSPRGGRPPVPHRIVLTAILFVLKTGTADYLAPELIKRAPTDHRVDLFALGVTAYEVITGHLPWEKGDSMQTLQYHLNIPGRDPREYVKNLDRKTTAFLLKAIERDPNRRFQTAAQFREALRHLPKR